jgi:hypothetical protein
MNDVTAGSTAGMRGSRPRVVALVGVLLAGLATMAFTSAPGTASGSTPARAGATADVATFATVARATVAKAAISGVVAAHRINAHSSLQPRIYNPQCSYNGLPPGTVVAGVVPGSLISFTCTGWIPNEQVTAAEASPLFFTAITAADEVDITHLQLFDSSPTGTLSGSFVVPNFAANDPAAACPPSADQVATGYYRCILILTDFASPSVGVDVAALSYPYGAATPPPATAVGMAATPDGGGYWVAWSDGFVVNHGNATWYGDASKLVLAAPIAHIVPTPDGLGYWLVAGDGGTFAYGDAGFYGSMGGIALNRPVVDLAPTADGKGYWLVGADGGIFAFGDASFHGSMGGQMLNRPVVGIAADTTTGGYWEVATDGGIFAFGAPFFGSTGNLVLNMPINGMGVTAFNLGYLFVASDGGIFAFGDAQFHGSGGNLVLNAPVVGMAIDQTTHGYWLVGADGGIFSYGAPFYGAG